MCQTKKLYIVWWRRASTISLYSQQQQKKEKKKMDQRKLRRQGVEYKKCVYRINAFLHKTGKTCRRFLLFKKKKSSLTVGYKSIQVPVTGVHAPIVSFSWTRRKFSDVCVFHVWSLGRGRKQRGVSDDGYTTSTHTYTQKKKKSHCQQN